MTANRYFEIADYARARAGRRLVLHVAVDGLQGKLLEGLVELSSGDRGGAGARYVEALVKEHQAPEMDPARYGSRLPPALGRDIVELAEEAPVRADYLENFRKYFFAADAPAVVVNVATVDSPSISVRNLPIIYSGHGVAGPHGTGIPNFSYLDRDTGRGWYFWGSDVLHMRDIFGNREDRIPGGRRRQGQGARTLFERLWRHSTASCMSSVDTGALEKISSEVGLAVGEVRRNFIEKVMVLRFRKRAAMERELNRRREWLMDHRGVSDSFLASLFTRPLTLATFRENARFLAEHEDEGLPDYTLWYSPWPDHFAHYTGPYADEIVGYRGEYDRLDFYLGKMIEVYASVPAAGGGGETCADRTLFGVVSDHGLVYTPRLVSIDEVLFAPLASCTYQKLTHDEGGMPAIHRDQGKPTRPFDAVVGSTAGGSYVIDLFGSGQGKGAGPSQAGGDEAAWRRHPDYHEIRSHRLLGGETIDWVETLRARLGDVIDLAVVREYGPGPGESWPREVESAVRLIGPGRGEARIRRHAGPGAEAAGRRRYRYEVLGGRDPLDLLGSVREFLIQPGGPATEEVRRALRECMESEEGCEDGRWEELLSYTLRPDAVHQLSHLYDSDRAGTINLFPLSHVGLNSTVPGRHAGEAFGEKNGVQLYRRTGLRRAALQTARNGSLPVTLYHWLAGDEAFRTPDPASGSPPALEFGYRSLLDEQAFTPIR
jgi:hypothetical protein